MAYFSQNTIATVREMYEFYLQRGSARIDCTASFCASARSALSALRKQDTAWYGVRLSELPLPEEEWSRDERGNVVCMMLTMEKAEGKAAGARAKALREAGMLREGGFAIPAEMAAKTEKLLAEAPPVMNPWNRIAVWMLLGCSEAQAVEKTIAYAKRIMPGTPEATLRENILRMWENNRNGVENDPLTQTCLAYWSERQAEVMADETKML